MQFKHKLIYFATGCAFVVIAQVLLNILVPQVTAQGKKVSAEFDTVKVRSLQVVDNSGKVCAVLEKTPFYATMDNVIQVFNRDGVSVYQVGVLTGGANVSMSDKNGKARVVIGAGTSGGVINAHGDSGSISVSDNDRIICAMMRGGGDGGAIDVYRNGRELAASIGAGEHGGRAEFYGNDGKPCAGIGVNEYGYGVVQTWNKDGVARVLGGVLADKSTSSSLTSRFPRSTTQKKEVYLGVGEGHWVSKVIESGKYVMLEDNSLWEVSPLDRINSMLWLVTEKITVLENKDGVYLLLYPYKLINSDSKNVVEAKYLGISK